MGKLLDLSGYDLLFLLVFVRHFLWALLGITGPYLIVQALL